MKIQPGARLGMLGGGQLGRMFCLDAMRAGYQVTVWTDEPNGSPAGQVANHEINAPYDDAAAFDEFIKQVDAVTVEFENIPVSLIEKISRHTIVHPSAQALGICQNREREKNFLRQNAIPCVDFYVITNADGLRQAMQSINGPAVLKTADFGYDGKGQRKLTGDESPQQIWQEFAAERAVLEAFAPFIMELSVVGCRTQSGHYTAFPACENQHVKHILDLSICPARVSAEVHAAAQSLAEKVTHALQYVGTLTVEFFLLQDQSLLVNEIAPRPHNSGHFTMDAATTSQFAMQWKTLCGWEVQSQMSHQSAVMINLLGDHWHDANTAPDWSPVLDCPNAFLHLYGKATAKKGRKMGHINLVGDKVDVLIAQAKQIQAALGYSV